MAHRLTGQRKAITRTNVDLDGLRHMVSLVHTDGLVQEWRYSSALAM